MKKKVNKNSNYSMAHVLYQRLGNDWYAFTEVDGDCFMSKVDPKAVETAEVKVPEAKRSNRKAPKAA